MADTSFPPAHDHAYRPKVQPSLERARRALAAGGAIVVPNPPPMAYGLLATTATAINALKGRAPDQAVAVSLHDQSEWQRLAPSIDVPPAAFVALVALLERRLSLLVPLRSQIPHPQWMHPAVQDGYLCLFNGRWTRTAIIWEQFPRLFGSSANLTGQAPAASAAQAMEMFGTHCPVVEVDAAGDPSRRRTASTMVRFDRDGRIGLHRKGIHDATSPSPPGGFLRQLAIETGLAIQADEKPEPRKDDTDGYDPARSGVPRAAGHRTRG